MNFFDFNLKQQSRSGDKKTSLTPGDYMSTVVSVDWADGYVEGKAIKIAYSLTDESGHAFEFSEIFWVCNSQRTTAFNDYLEENGIDNIGDFVGCSEKLTLKNDIRKGHTYLNIDKREFLSRSKGGDEDVMEV